MTQRASQARQSIRDVSRKGTGAAHMKAAGAKVAGQEGTP